MEIKCYTVHDKSYRFCDLSGDSVMRFTTYEEAEKCLHDWVLDILDNSSYLCHYQKDSSACDGHVFYINNEDAKWEYEYYIEKETIRIEDEYDG